jgi:hypothetical protein
VRLILALLLCLVSLPVWATCGGMGFGGTFGTSGTTDKLLSGYTTAPVLQMSYFIRTYIHGTGGSNFGQLWSQSGSSNLNNASMNMRPGGSVVSFNQVWSGGGGSGFWTFPAPSFNTWHNILCTYDGSSSSNAPVCYVDGTSQTISILTAPSGTITLTSQNYYIGNYQPSTLAFDGIEADFAVWSGAILTAAEDKSLANGASPLQIRPKSLVLYAPLCNQGLGLIGWGPTPTSLTVAGAKAQPQKFTNGHPLLGFDGVN